MYIQMTLHTDTIANLSILIYILNHCHDIIRNLIRIIIIVEKFYTASQLIIIQHIMCVLECLLYIGRIFSLFAIHLGPIALGTGIVVVEIFIRNIVSIYHIFVVSTTDMCYHIFHIILKTFIHGSCVTITIITVVIVFEEPAWCLLMPNHCMHTYGQTILRSDFQYFINIGKIHNRNGFLCIPIRDDVSTSFCFARRNQRRTVTKHSIRFHLIFHRDGVEIIFDDIKRIRVSQIRKIYCISNFSKCGAQCSFQCVCAHGTSRRPPGRTSGVCRNPYIVNRRRIRTGTL